MQQQPADDGSVDALRAAWLVHANDAAAAVSWQAARLKGEEQRQLDAPVTAAERSRFGLTDATSSYPVHTGLPSTAQEVAEVCSMLAPHNTPPNGDTLQRQRPGTACYDIDGLTSVKVWNAVADTPFKLARIAGTCTLSQQGQQPAVTYRVYRVLVWRPGLTPELQEQQQQQQAQWEAWEAQQQVQPARPQKRKGFKCEPPMWWFPHALRDGAAGYVGGVALYEFIGEELDSGTPAAPVDAAAAAAAGNMEGVEEEEEQQQTDALAAALQQQMQQQLSLAESSTCMRRLHACSRLLKLQLLALGAGYCGSSSARLFSTLLPCVAAHNADVGAAEARGVQGAGQLAVEVLRVADRLGRSLLHLLATASLARAAPEQAVATAEGHGRRLNRLVLYDDAALAAAGATAGAAGMAATSSLADVARSVRAAAAATAAEAAAGSSFDTGPVRLELLHALKQHALGAAADDSVWRQALAAFNSGGATPFHTACHFCEPEVLQWFVTEMSEQDMLLVLTRNGRAFWHVIARQAKALQDSGRGQGGIAQLDAGLRFALQALADAVARQHIKQHGAAGSPGSSSGLSSGPQQLIGLDSVAGPRPAKQPKLTRGRFAGRWPTAVLEHLSRLLFHLHPSKYDVGMLHASVHELFGFDSL